MPLLLLNCSTGFVQQTCLSRKQLLRTLAKDPQTRARCFEVLSWMTSLSLPTDSFTFSAALPACSSANDVISLRAHAVADSANGLSPQLRCSFVAAFCSFGRNDWAKEDYDRMPIAHPDGWSLRAVLSSFAHNDLEVARELIEHHRRAGLPEKRSIAGCMDGSALSSW